MPPRLTAMPPRLASPAPRIGPAQGDARAQDRARERVKPWRAWYRTARWRKLRRKILARAGHVCEQTGVPLLGRAPAPDSAVIDHIRPHRGDPALFWDEDNLQAVSKAWHDGAKQRAERAAGD
ncbi:5-methylcytosine-specific restriction endonuclease McrA [Rhodovulum sulfidophilum]|uniref:HNH endonuclease signature motif containing protein n=1 Tax=Rhodovulum sulfidophilum TaxID=35806 RepID=UPI0005AB77E2|nr:HNH endonuclease [Rhodovulum sulfidophilum]ANB35179.1 endonuclease [Rhodovulum sulfidophilum DSM 1374]ANB39001.1 endonuclease [Rhodovulum sulfidophilum]MCW2305615.1 5-methylcytosine-specific restriction endonuclease McrA [Rhodovulum sulfidophilum]